jgi:quercetin dioxygenase-like cupin family protein
MVSVGDVMANPVSGERFVWRATRESTAGEYCEFDLFLEPGATVILEHVHPSQVETFTAVRGDLKLIRAGVTSIVEEGAEATVPAGVAHGWANNTDAVSQTTVRVTPSLNIEDFFAKFCALATAGKTTKAGLARNPLQLAVITWAYRHEMTLPNPVLWAILQPILIGLAAIGRLFGLRPTV